MPLVGDCCVNLSGRNVTVTDGNNRAIGELMNREFFTVIGAEGSLVAIYFLGPSGQPLRGYLNGAPASSKTPIHTRPYGTVSLNGQNYVAFMMRQTMNLYNFNGQVVGSVAAGKRVLCKPLSYCERIQEDDRRNATFIYCKEQTGSVQTLYRAGKKYP